MDDTEVDEFLEHHGVKGMKWGIRNDEKKVGPSGKKLQVSEKPWSSYSKKDYTPQQWHNACLIHNHSGKVTTKAQCKLPIKTPNGVVNQHGVYSAAAALAGARGGVMATSAQKDHAASALIHIYRQMGHKPPPSLRIKHSDVDEFLIHYGVKGMHWGIRDQHGHPLITKRRKAVAKGFGVGVGVGAIAAGAAYSNHYMKKHGGLYIKVSTLNKLSKNRLIFGSAAALAGAAYTQQTLKKHGKKDMMYVNAHG